MLGTVNSVPKRDQFHSGQTLVEFALSLTVLLLLIFGVIEGGRLLHGWITLQNAAREGGRYAITGQYEESCLIETPACPDARVWSIGQRVLESSTGLSIDSRAGYEDPRYFRVEVSGVDKNNVWRPDYPGLPGKPVMVRATYKMPIITPILRPIADSVRLSGQVVVNNENYAQVSSSNSDIEIGDLPPPPPPSIPVADLEIRNTASPLVSLISEPIEYELQITNHGPDEARGVELIDQLPANVTLRSTSPAGVCEQNGQDVTCRPPNLPRGVRYDIVLTVDGPPQPPPAPGTLTNQATVSGSEDDDDLSNNQDSASTLVVISEDVADLTIVSIDDAPEPVVINHETTYTILIGNNGISDASRVDITSELPEGFTFVSASASEGKPCYESGTNVVCQIGDLAKGQTKWAEVTARAPSAPGSAVFTATVSGNEVDPDDRNNSGSEVTTVQPEWSDLYVSMSDWPDPVLAGGEIVYTIIAGNNGPSDASQVRLTDTLPEGSSLVSATTPQGSCSETGGEVICDLGVLLRNQEVPIEIIVVIEVTGTITNRAAVTSQETDPNPVNDQTTAVTTVAPAADLRVSKTADPTSPPGVQAGEKLTYTITVANDGPSPATNVEVSDDLPVDLSFLRVSSTKGTCAFLGDTLLCFVGNMAKGDSATITVETIPEQPGVVVNRASVSSRQADTDHTNNAAIDTTTVLAASNQFITLDPACGDPGSTVTVKGFNWPSEGSKDIDIYWGAVDNSNLIETVQDNGILWTQDLVVPPSAVPGSHSIIAVRQRDDAEAIFTVPCPAPNLTTTQPELVSPAPLAANDPATFQVEVTNDGDLDAVNQFFVGLYFDPPPPAGPSPTHIPQDYRVELVAVSWLAAGDSRIVTITEENGFSTEGVHQVYVVVDSDPGPEGLIKELDESDNISAVLEIEADAATAPTPTPGPTPVITETGSLIGQAFLSTRGGQLLPQAGVEVEIFDLNSGSLERVGYTDFEGSYFLTDLIPGAKSVVACIIIDDIQYAYAATGVEVVSGQYSFKDLFLEEGSCN